MSTKGELKQLRVMFVAPDKPALEVEADEVDFRESGELALLRDGKLVAVIAAGQWVSCVSLTRRPFWADEAATCNTYSVPPYSG
jgi:hypothetical protein